MATPEEKRHQEGIGFEKENLKALQKINETIKEQSKILGDPPKKNVEEVKEQKAENKKFLDELKSIIKSTGLGDKTGKVGIFANIKKMMKKYSGILLGLLGVGMVALFTQLDMKKIKEMWLSLKGALQEMRKVLEPMAKAMWKWAKDTALPATAETFIKFFDRVKVLFSDIKKDFEGWDQKDWKEKIETIFNVFGSLGDFVWDTAVILLKWVFKLFGADGEMMKESKQEGEKLKKTWLDDFKDTVIAIGQTILGIFVVSKLFGKKDGGFQKGLTGKFRDRLGLLLLGPFGILGIIGTVLKSIWKHGLFGAAAVGMTAGAGAAGTAAGTVSGKMKNIGKSVGKGGNALKDVALKPFRDAKWFGQGMKAGGERIWGLLGKIFGRSWGFIKLLGRVTIMSMITNPWGWGMLLAIGIGALVYNYWEDIEKMGSAAMKGFKDSMSTLSKSISGAVGGAKNMVVKFLREKGMGALADDLEGSGKPSDRFGAANHAMTQEEREAKFKRLKREQEGGAKHYKTLRGKLAMTQSDIDKLEKKQTPFTGDEKASHYSLRMQRSRLNEQIEKQKKKNNANEIRIIKEMAGKLKASKDLNVDISGTGQAGFDMMGHEGQFKTNLLAKFLNSKGGLRMTSGWRSTDTGNDAMWKNEETLAKNYGKFLSTAAGKGAGLTPGELSAGKESDLRKSGIEKMRAAGFFSQHEHGNAIDFSTPGGYDGKFSTLWNDLVGPQGAFPGALLKKEGTHLHMQFNKNRSGLQVAQLQADNSMLNRPSGGNGNGTNVGIKQGDNIQNNTSWASPPKSSVNPLGKTPVEQQTG